MGLVLSIETATRVCSVTLARDGDVIGLKETTEEKSHATLLTVFIEEILKEQNISISDVDAIAVSKGPGSYTGLRIGVSAAKGLCYGAGKPLIAVSTLQAMAYGAMQKIDKKLFSKKNILLCPMIDARRMEVFTALFDIEFKQTTPIEAMVLGIDSYSHQLKKNNIIFFGNGADKFKEIIDNEAAIFLDHVQPSAKYVAYFAEIALKDGKFEDTAYFEPYYLKDFIATIPKKIF